MSDAAAALVLIKALQAAFLFLHENLPLENNRCPVRSNIETINSIGSFDYVMVGAGTAGSVLATRMSETNATILLLEEGGCPPLESYISGVFPYIPLSPHDHAFTFKNDSYACQNQRPIGGGTAGKLIGGSGALHHLLHVATAPEDFEPWAEATDDSSWNYDTMIKYIVKSENTKNEMDKNPSLHGDSGPTMLKKVECSLLTEVIDAHQEMGIAFKNDSEGISLTKPWVTIGNDIRQCGPSAYLSRSKNRPNLYILTGAVATKITFEGTTTTGVEFTHKGLTHSATAKKRVIVSAGALRTPQLLMLSGIGDKDALAPLNIPSVVHNPHVGQNLMDHVGALFVIALDKSTDVATDSDPHQFPAHVVINHGGFEGSQIPERQDIFLNFNPNTTGLLHLCTNAFKYLNPICDAWYKHNIDRNVVLVASNLMHPVSKGCVSLSTASALDQPVIELGILSNRTDLDNFAQLLFQYVGKLLNTKSLKNVGAEFVDVGLCGEHEKFGFEFWKCYVLAMSTTYWHYMGTCSFGKVVDGRMNVIGTKGLSVVDASVISYPPSGKLGSYVRPLAERAADIFKEDDGWNC